VGAATDGIAPWRHLGVTAGAGIAVIAGAGSQLHDLRAWQLAGALAVLVVANALEWHLHRDVLHRGRGGLVAVQRSHVGLHHARFRHDDMAMRSPRELGAVLLKPWAIPALAVALSPAAAGLALVGQRNLAALLMVVGVGYLLAYELLHLACHLPGGTRGVLGAVARHHARHHDPRLMAHANFNVIVPLWDVVRGTRSSAP
jgi:hypothetical protein